MINLIEKNQLYDDLIQEFSLVKGDLLYECFLDNKKIGYAIIRKKTDDRIFLVIAKQHQNKGYGNIIFKLLLSKIDGPVICSVPFENIKMQRIIKNNNGIQSCRNGEAIQYIIEK